MLKSPGFDDYGPVIAHWVCPKHGQVGEVRRTSGWREDMEWSSVEASHLMHPSPLGCEDPVRVEITS